MDEPFLEVAVSGRAEALITGNVKHYSFACRGGARVLSPSEFIKYFNERR
jgi:predicted nucleic acid-binding protein